jgi:hypothetical protein
MTPAISSEPRTTASAIRNEREATPSH